MTLLVWVCETRKNQTQDISITIHDLLNSINDKQIKNEIIHRDHISSFMVERQTYSLNLGKRDFHVHVNAKVCSELILSSKIQQYVKSKMWKKCRLFHATDFQSLMYPCFTFCYIIGIFPYKINASTFEFSKSHYIVSTVVVCVCCAFNLAYLYNIISTFNFEIKIRNLEIVCFYILNSFVIIITHILSGPRMRLLQTIMEISKRLSSKSYQKLSKLIHVKDIFGTIFVVVQVCLYIFQKRKNKNRTSIMHKVFALYQILLEFEINMLYINCVCVLKASFKRIDENVAHLQKIVVKPRVPTLICQTQRNQFLLIELKILKKQHLMISDAVQMLNVIFSLQLLATILLTFCVITFEIYSYAVRWQNGILINIDIQFIFTLFTSIGHYIIKMTLLVWACETSKNQAQEIITTVHDLLNSTNDEQIKNELQLFSLQILHCKNIFSTKGLTMDATLLAIIVGNITIYLIILIQFLNTSHFCDGKTAINITI
ncbi:PREDICTED: uncharacterized protein LOC108765527 [Trachymyrmex cornetzi]|uniref:uncharacterized protein LOC108765527 n=1 Tax=Trachymyrmex cornetzi TaxID=471704 RepID=UPI00084EF00F|nr:PREDICTED: uncharacterized protein LOC108765527 [Trachymyrmex cornetzi]